MVRFSIRQSKRHYFQMISDLLINRETVKWDLKQHYFHWVCIRKKWYFLKALNRYPTTSHNVDSVEVISNVLWKTYDKVEKDFSVMCFVMFFFSLLFFNNSLCDNRRSVRKVNPSKKLDKNLNKKKIKLNEFE